MNDHEDLTRRLSASAPTPEQPPSFFDGLGLLATQSTPTPAPPRGRRLLRVAAVAVGTTLMLSSAAYAGALGSSAQDHVRHVLGHHRAAHHLVDRTPAPTENVAPAVVLDVKAEDDADESTVVPSDDEPTIEPRHHAAPPPLATGDDPGDSDEPDTEPAEDPGEDDQGEDPGDDDQGDDDQGEDSGDDSQGEDSGDDDQGEDPGDDDQGEDPGDDDQGSTEASDGSDEQ
jgi:hypothetical protein